MGGDGQALTNKRSLLQKSRAYVTSSELEEVDSKEKQTLRARNVERWSHCAISLEPLELPAAFGADGNICSKQSVLDYLLKRREATAEGLSGDADALQIRKLSDVREISNETEDSDTICCPITGFATSSGMHAFAGFWGCGHVVCSSTLPKWTGLDSQVDVACPFCGQKSFYVRLLLDKDEDSLQQLSFLRSHLKKFRKRGREE